MANLKDLIVYGKARALDGFIGNLTGLASRATADADGNTISTTYLKSANLPTKLSDFTDDLGTSPVHSHSQYLPLSGGTLTGNLSFNIQNKAAVSLQPNEHGLTITAGGISLGINQEAYSGLYYYNGTKSRYVAFTDMKGIANGIASLDANIKVPVAQIPDLSSIYLTSHQSIKSLKTDNTTAQSTSSSESITGSGTINLHKIAKTGTFSDLLSKPTSISGYGITDAYTKTEVDGMISSVYKPAGSRAFGYLPTLNPDSSDVLGNVYNITDAFTTTSDFIEGAGKSYPAGTNVVVVNNGTISNPDYKFDVLSGFVDLSGYVPTTRMINNKSLSADITLTASDVGAIDSHQSIKTLNTNNTTAQTANASETITGSGSISLHKVSKTGSYNDLLNKPTIPTVNNATLTIQQNGTQVATFSANASSNVTANISTTVVKFRDWSTT